MRHKTDGRLHHDEGQAGGTTYDDQRRATGSRLQAIAGGERLREDDIRDALT